MWEVKDGRFWVWDDDLKKSLNQDSQSNGNVGSNVDVNHLLKVATNEERICLYEEQIMELKMMLAKEEHHFQANSKVVVELRKKIAKQHTKIYIERKIVKVLGCIEVFLWGLLSVVTIAFAMK